MNPQSKYALLAVLAVGLLASCKSKKEKFEISGTIQNSNASMVYLEEHPVATMDNLLVDSVEIGKDGKYSLQAEASEAKVYAVRLDRQEYPIAIIVNDAPKVTLDATFNAANNKFPELTDIKNSPASQELKDYMARFNNGFVSIFSISRRADSIYQLNPNDSSLTVLQQQFLSTVESLKDDFKKTIDRSNNPALTLFILGFFQQQSQNPALNGGLSAEEVAKVIDDAIKKFPKHDGLAAIKAGLDKRKQVDEQNMMAFSLIGKQAPEIIMPDVNGKEVRLSNFKGKYVLVDFWASWCGPCRKENPNVVKAFNKFRDKNFTVLGVSLDAEGEKDKWLEAIQKDGLTWTHISELKKWNSSVVQTYGFQGIPYNVLVDPDGKVIAEDLRGDALEMKLQEVLK